MSIKWSLLTLIAPISELLEPAAILLPFQAVVKLLSKAI